METLTGNKRYRIHKPFFKPALLVLQLEIKVTGVLDCCGGMVDTMPPYIVWVDATIELLQEYCKLKGVDNDRVT